MGAVARPAPAPVPRVKGLSALWVAFALFAVTLLTRLPNLGNPVLYNDEQFYLLVGSRMLDGALPYVDIWDRKPVGLFLLYAGTSALGPWELVQNRLVACLFVAATAGVLYRLALLIAKPTGALLAALLYPVLLLTFELGGGQTPVFYNLFVAAVAWWLAVRIGNDRAWPLVWPGCVAMLAIGCAMQIKYSAIFEGLFFGLALLWLARRRGLGWPQTLMRGALWAACALLPTAAAAGWYAAAGYWDAFAHANFRSIFLRRPEGWGAAGDLAQVAALLTPLLFLAGRGRGERRPAIVSDGKTVIFLRFWAVAAVAGFLIFGSYHKHYAGPLLVPLLTLAAPALACRATGRRAAAIVLAAALGGAALAAYEQRRNYGTPGEFASLARVVERDLGGSGCLYVYEGDIALYNAAHACLATPFSFPTHLNSERESAALGVAPVYETERLLAAAPAVITLMARPHRASPNTGTRAMVRAALAADYRFVVAVPRGKHRVEVWRRKPT